MAQTILLKRSSTSSAVPSTSALQLGELAVNTYDGKVFLKKDDGTESIVTLMDSNTVINESDVTNLVSDLASKINVSEKAAANGVATLDASGLIPNAQLPALAITSTYSASSESDQLALTVQEGDVAVRTDLNKSYIALNSTNSSMSDWQELLTPTDAVTSVNGATGVVSLTTTDINEGTNLYYTDARVDARFGTLSIGGLTDVSLSSPANGNVLTFDGTNWKNITPPAGITTFTGLSDTPTDFTGNAGNIVSVNAGETALEFTNTIDGGSY